MSTNHYQASIIQMQQHPWREQVKRTHFSQSITDQQIMVHQVQQPREKAPVYGVDLSVNSVRLATVESTNRSVKQKRKMMDKKYRRYEKPPYSYVGLIALAIQSSESKKLKLSEILQRISAMFPFFQGKYQGWRDSVRHNLTQNKCFKKVLTEPFKPHSKGNFWTVDVDKIPPDKLKRQNTYVSRNVAPGLSYARNLKDVFDLYTGKPKVAGSISKQQLLVNDSANCKVGSTETKDNDQSDIDKVTSCNERDENKEVLDFSWNKIFESSSNYPRFLLQQSSPVGSDKVNSSTDSFDCNSIAESKDENWDLSNQSCAETNKCANLDETSDNEEYLMKSSLEDLCFSCKENYLKSIAKPEGDKSINQDCGFALKLKATTEHPCAMQNVDSAYSSSNQYYSYMAKSSYQSKKETPVHQTCLPSVHCGERDTSHSFKTLTNIDQSVGPEGPPNVTWLSSDPLKSVKRYFDPTFSNKDYLKQGTTMHSVEQTPFPDQTEFLTEQALILKGRRDYRDTPRKMDTSQQSLVFVPNNQNYKTNSFSIDFIDENTRTITQTCSFSPDTEKSVYPYAVHQLNSNVPSHGFLLPQFSNMSRSNHYV